MLNHWSAACSCTQWSFTGNNPWFLPGNAVRIPVPLFRFTQVTYFLTLLLDFAKINPDHEINSKWKGIENRHVPKSWLLLQRTIRVKLAKHDRFPCLLQGVFCPGLSAEKSFLWHSGGHCTLFLKLITNGSIQETGSINVLSYSSASSCSWSRNPCLNSVISAAGLQNVGFMFSWVWSDITDCYSHLYIDKVTCSLTHSHWMKATCDTLTLISQVTSKQLLNYWGYIIVYISILFSCWCLVFWWMDVRTSIKHIWH
jgi:hypothetical protein